MKYSYSAYLLLIWSLPLPELDGDKVEFKAMTNGKAEEVLDVIKGGRLNKLALMLCRYVTHQASQATPSVQCDSTHRRRTHTRGSKKVERKQQLWQGRVYVPSLSHAACFPSWPDDGLRVWAQCERLWVYVCMPCGEG